MLKKQKDDLIRYSADFQMAIASLKR